MLKALLTTRGHRKQDPTNKNNLGWLHQIHNQYFSKISSNRVNVALPYIYVTDFVSSIDNLKAVLWATYG